MRHVIIGTAGHVDHGKTCLIKALTGIDTDRLKEEKKRGITIELGFAYLDFPDGGRAGIIDVPGHEKFVKNMLAGAGGMDVAVLVVAADEGVMPQTVEHLDILSILGIRTGVVVITKTDLVEPEFLDLVREDVAELIRGTFLEGAPILPVSVYKNQGLDALKETLAQICSSLPRREEHGEFRLPVDRVFTLKGFGTIVTGTLMEGKLKKDQEAVLYPENAAVKVRSIQVHGASRDTAYAGERAAVNIPDRKKEEISRGDILALKGSMDPSYMLDIRAEALKHAERSIVSGSRVHVYHGTRELLGKIILMDRAELKPGESCYAQLRLEEITAAKKWDRCVLRFYSPAQTIGGGVILDACPPKRRRNTPSVLEKFRIKESGSPVEMLELAVLESWGRFDDVTEIARRYSLNRSSAKKLADSLCQEKKLFCLGGQCYIHKEELSYYRRKTDAFLKRFHEDYPLKEGMALEEARSRLGLAKSSDADRILAVLEQQKVIKIQNGAVSRKKFQVVVKEDETAMMQEILQYYLEAGYAPLTTALYTEEHRKQKRFPAVLTSLLNKRQLIRLDGQYCIHREYYDKAKDVFRDMASQGEAVVLGQYRDRLGCSRKVAVALLEHFDKTGFTRKTEEGRILK